MTDWDIIGREIARATGDPGDVTEVRPVGGGCINTTTMVQLGPRRYFVKRNETGRRDMFDAEADGLRALQRTGAVRVPAPICSGVAPGGAFLALEYIELRHPDRRAEERLGRALAALHRCTHEQFGWHRDNTIGTTPQANAFRSSWVAFFGEQRLGVQLELARENGYGAIAARGEQLRARLGALLADHDCRPALLHGDLWSGNVGATAGGVPVIFDPAVYFGDREADLAMTELFGGFSPAFYAAYREAWPLAPGYEVRRMLYNLYHLLNHLNLFGPSYASQVQSAIARLLADVR